MKRFCLYSLFMAASLTCFSALFSLTEQERGIVKEYLLKEEENEVKQVAQLKEDALEYFWNFEIHKKLSFEKMIEGVSPLTRSAIKNFAYDLDSDKELSSTLPLTLVFFYGKIKKVVDNFETRVKKFNAKLSQLRFQNIIELLKLSHFTLSLESITKTLNEVPLTDPHSQSILLQGAALLATSAIELIEAISQAIKEHSFSLENESTDEWITIDSFIDSLPIQETKPDSTKKSEL